MSDAPAQWQAVDEYFSGLFAAPDAALAGALRASTEAGLPEISVSPNQGKFLQLLVRMNRAKRVLEIGTLGGYSTIWMARGLPPDGRLITLELDAKHALVARENIRTAELDGIVTLREGAALESLQQMDLADEPPFDFIFIDADKPNIPHYFNWALRLSQPGSVIVVDNVVRRGAVADTDSTDASVLGVRQFSTMAAHEPRVSGTVLQTVGIKGYDGLAVLLVVEPAVS